MNEETQRVIEQRGAALAALSKHPSYNEWVAEIHRRKERDLRKLVTDALRSGKPVDQREFDRVRGFWQGAEYAVGVPEHAEDTLTKALERARAEEAE
jgi:hypothetical protein